MQNWKIRRMSVKLLKEWLDAISKLLSHYLGINKLESIFCPICFKDCDDCLWWIIERKSCADFRVEVYPDASCFVDTSALRSNPNKYRKWKKIRISQLMNWEKIMQAELKRRADQGA